MHHCIHKGDVNKLKIKKKAAMIISFTVGSLMFATTAMAEINTKSGYDQLKDSLKYTAEGFTEKLSNYTLDMSFVLRDNNTIISSSSSLNKYDVSKEAMENTSTSMEGKKKTETYYYADMNGFINYNSDQGVYYVNDYTSPRDVSSFKNPFDEDAAGDIEKIADAVVGNLKDYVVVSENPDGSKELSSSLNDTQIPAIANALVSYQFKRESGAVRNPNNTNPIPKLTKDIFVKETKGTALVNKDGLIQKFLGTGILSGKDDNGKVHNLTVDILIKVTDINKTIVKKPDLSGKKVEKTVQRDYSKLSNPEMYVGTYKNDIVIEKDGKFHKIGDRFVDVTHVDDNNIAGRYHEEYKKGYEEYASKAKDFKYDAKFEKEQLGGFFNYTNSSSKSSSGHISIDPHSVKIYFSFDEIVNGSLIMDSQFNRVFN
jgi:hypothetical protein